MEDQVKALKLKIAHNMTHHDAEKREMVAEHRATLEVILSMLETAEIATWKGKHHVALYQIAQIRDLIEN